MGKTAKKKTVGKCHRNNSVAVENRGEIALGDESESVCSRQQRCGSLVGGWLEFLDEQRS